MEVYTTGQVAKLCNVAPGTVSKWFDTGRLKGYRIPGSPDRRIPKRFLLRFMRDHGVPTAGLEEEYVAKVLVVAPHESTLFGEVKRSLHGRGLTSVAEASSEFEAGLQWRSFEPDLLVVDFADQALALGVVMSLRCHDSGAFIPVVAIQGDRMAGVTIPVTETFRRPFDPNLLGERVISIVGQKKKLFV